jgi:hypothetical protein
MNERRFAVIFGAHGITSRAPQSFDLTQAEAEAQAAEWRDRACTVGGTADIIEKP